MTVRTEEEIIRDFIYYLENRINRIDTSSDTVVRDVFIDAEASVINDEYSNLQDVQTAQGYSSPSTVSDDKMDNLAYNWELERKSGTYAQSFITFTSYNKPTDTIVIGNTDGSGGVIVSTRRRSDGTVVRFRTLETAYLTSSTAIDSNGYYSVSTPVICSDVGIIGNVAAGALTTLDTSVRGVDSVTNNVAATGGKDQETNLELAARIVAKAKGLHRGTAEGFRSVALQTPSVLDARAIGPNDAGVTRKPDGGGVDVYLLGDNLSSYIEDILYSAGTLSYDLTKKPVSSLTKLSATVGLTYSDLVETVDYDLQKDTTSEYATSVNAEDKVVFTDSGDKPNDGTQFTVSYLYDKNIEDVQELLDNDDTYFVTSDNLVKTAQPVLLNIGLTLTRYPAYTRDQVEDDSLTVISNYVNNLLLGERVEQSDIVSELKDLDSVDNIGVPFRYMYKRDDVIVTSEDSISTTNLQYLRVDGDSIFISVN